MNIRQMRWIVGSLLAIMLLAMNIANEPVVIGISIESRPNSYRFAGGTGPLALVLSVVLIAVYFLQLTVKPPSSMSPLAGIVRRFFAFWVDIIFGVLMLAPFVGLIPVMVEWSRTGEFQWAFEREVAAAGDGLQSLFGFLLVAVGLVTYFVLPLLHSRSTLGDCLMGYQVVWDANAHPTTKRAIGRTLLGFIALSAAYLAPFLKRDKKKGKFWLDIVFDTHAVKW